MAQKDLNLSMDEARLQAWASNNRGDAPPPEQYREQPVPAYKQQSEPEPSGRTARRTAVTPLSRQPTSRGRPPTRPAAQKARPASGQWLLIATIAVANMAFLVLAGVWLTGTDLKAALAQPSAFTGPEIAADLTDIRLQLSDIQVQLIALTAQLEQSPPAAVVAVEKQKKALILEPQNEQIKERQAAQNAVQNEEPKKAAIIATSPILPAVAAPVQDASAKSPQTDPVATKAPPVIEPQWHVHLGDYFTQEEAEATRSLLATLGLNGEISQQRVNSRSIFLVNLGGYTQRETAEQVAGQIMAETQLNGLWVARAQ